MKNHPVLRSPKFKRAVQQRQGKNYGLYTMSSKTRAQSDENQIEYLKKCYTFNSKPRYSTTYEQEAVDLLCPRLININIMLISLSKQVNIAARTTVFDQSWPNLSQEHRLKWLKAPKVDMWKCHFQQNNVIHAIYYFIYVKKKSISTKGPFWNEAVNCFKKKSATAIWSLGPLFWATIPSWALQWQFNFKRFTASCLNGARRSEMNRSHQILAP